MVGLFSRLSGGKIGHKRTQSKVEKDAPDDYAAKEKIMTKIVAEDKKEAKDPSLKGERKERGGPKKQSTGFSAARGIETKAQGCLQGAKVKPNVKKLNYENLSLRKLKAVYKETVVTINNMILAYVSQVLLPDGVVDNKTVTYDQIESNIVRCPDREYAQKMIDAIDDVRVRGDSVGGVVTCIARNVTRALILVVLDGFLVIREVLNIFIPLKMNRRVQTYRAEHARCKTVTAMDIVYALKR